MMTEEKKKEEKKQEKPKRETFQDILSRMYKNRYYMVEVFLHCLDVCLVKKNHIDFADKNITDFLEVAKKLEKLYNEYKNGYDYERTYAMIGLDEILDNNSHYFRGFIIKAQEEEKIYYEPEDENKIPNFEDVADAVETDKRPSVDEIRDLP